MNWSQFKKTDIPSSLFRAMLVSKKVCADQTFISGAAARALKRSFIGVGSVMRAKMSFCH